MIPAYTGRYRNDRAVAKRERMVWPPGRTAFLHWLAFGPDQACDLRYRMTGVSAMWLTPRASTAKLLVIEAVDTNAATLITLDQK
jgi:hypothetical protein